MKLTPLGDRVVLKQLEAETKTKSGIVLTTATQEKPQEAEVIAVGPGTEDVKMEVSVGQKVIYSKYAGTEVKYEGEDYIIVKQDDILAIVEYFVVKKEANNYIEAKSLGIFLAIAFIIVFYYTYTGIIGKNFFIIDILTFIISIILGEWVSYKLMIRKSESTTLSKTLSLAIIFYFLISFILFTYNPPNINLFKDPTQIMNRLYM